MSGSNFDIAGPRIGATTDPNARIYQKLAELETRLMAQENKRDLVVQPLILLGNGASTTYNYGGGRLWLVLGGDANAGATAGVVGYTMKFNGVTVMSIFVNAAAFTSEAVGMSIAEIPNIATGTLTILVNNYIGQTVSFACRSLLIEWPQA